MSAVPRGTTAPRTHARTTHAREHTHTHNTHTHTHTHAHTHTHNRVYK
jgi:hypothetical protein